MPKNRTYLTPIAAMKSLHLFFTKISVRGGINEVYRKCWEQASRQEEDLFFYNMISAYAFAAMFWLPTGKYEVSYDKLHAHALDTNQSFRNR